MNRDLLACLLLTCFALVLFAPVRNHDFINYDDPGYLREPIVQRGLTDEGVKWAFTATKMGNWHPLTWLSHMADVQLFGMNPAGHHLVSVLLHAINAVLLYLLLRSATQRFWESAAVAALWAVHPLRVESVAWVAERKDLLCALFFLLAIHAYVRFARKQSWGAYGMSLVLFSLGLMCKPMIVTLPFVLFLLDCLPLKTSASSVEPRQARVGKLVIEKLPFFVLTVASACVTMIVQRQGGAMSTGDYPPMVRFGNALSAVASYLQLTFWPRGMAVVYPYNALSPARVAIGVMLLIGVTIIGIVLWRRERAILIGWLWFLGMLVPVIGIVQVGWQSMADRYMYLPQIGLIVAIVWGAALLSRLRPVLAVLAAVAVIALSLRTLNQLAYWRDSKTLFARALDVTTHNHIAHANLALALSEEGDIDGAIEHYREAIAIRPDDAPPYYNIARLLAQRGQLDESRRLYEQAIERKPDYVEAHVNLAQVLSRLGLHHEAIYHNREAILLKGDDFLAHYDLAVELAENGRVNEAIPEFAEAVRLKPDSPEAQQAYRMALRAAGNGGGAATREKPPVALPNPATNPDNRPSTR